MKRVIALWLILISCSWYPVDAARQFSGTTQALEVTSAVVSAPPFSVCLWMYPTAANSSKGLFAIETDGSSDHRFALITNTASQITFNIRTTSASTATALNTFSQNTWHHVCATAASTTDRKIWVDADDANKGTATGNLTPAGMNRTRIGRFGGAYFTGRIAEVSIWSNVALTLPEIVSLKNGTHPSRVGRLNLISHVPIWGVNSPEIDAAAARSWTLEGTPTAAGGPPVGLFSMSFGR